MIIYDAARESAMVLVAKDILEKDFLLMPGDTNLFQGTQQIRNGRDGFVIVADSEGKAIGVVTEWDNLSKVVAEGKDPKDVKVEELMTKDLIALDPEVGIDELSQFMATKGIRRVIVVDDGSVLGIITSRTVLGDLLVRSR